MTSLSEGALDRLRESLRRPELPERYRVIELLGQGGMGVVWRARDSVLERDVAIKLIAPHADSAALAPRLEREARILAALEHPGIVPVYDLGVLEDGTTWYVMRLVRGAPLDVAARTVESRRELLRIVEQLCDTIAYAHAHGVVHRDLTPRNVMLGPFGEVLVLDWGVARERGARQPDTGAPPATWASGNAIDVVTKPGTIVGTPGYMSPEQAAGSAADERSDVYGLGAILRDLIAMHADPVPRPLRAILERACAQTPAGRYPSPLALRDDLRRFAAGERVSAHRETMIETIGRLVHVYRTPILLVLAYLVMRIAIMLWRGI